MIATPPTMPSGDSPLHAQQHYLYQQAHQQTMYHPDTWHVRWVDRLAVGLSDRSGTRAHLVGLAVPDDAPKEGRLSSRQLRRLHD
jgi:hypothetical protein